MTAAELVDLIDDSDRVIGQAPRSDVRRKNLRHRSAYVLVFNSTGQLFIHRRTPTKDVFPGYWDVAVGGVLNAGEDYDAGAKRELREELGVEGAALRRLFALRFDSSHNRVAGMVYSCACDGPFRVQASEIAEWTWIDLDVLLDRTQHDSFCPDSLEALRLYLAKLDAARHRR
jgi:isopentenyldiphosphate isomerase